MVPLKMLKLQQMAVMVKINLDGWDGETTYKLLFTHYRKKR